MKRQIPWIVACAMLWLSACCSAPHPKVDPEARRAAAINNRWIGVTRPLHKSCPVPATAGWSVRPLVPLDGLRQDLQASVRKAKLDRFCVYDYHGENPHPELPREVLRRLRPGAEPDRLALTTSANSLEEKIWKHFYTRFLGQVQLPTPTPPAGREPSVRLAFLDSQKTGDGVAQAPPSGSSHGYALTNIAGQLVSKTQGEGPFSVQIGSRLALPLVKLDPDKRTELERDETQGGSRGSYADLTTAIVEEIGDWDPQPGRHLVLNLSVGWDGEKFGGWEKKLKDMPPEVQAIYTALKVAADRGVLVVAAAGNERSDTSPTKQPLLPGGWESLGPQPLVYAVSGVDAKDHPLVNTREKGEAPRVAYADHVAVPDLNDPEKHTPTMTGTSVATAVASTAAALVWSYRPDLTPQGVMQLLDASATALPRKADFAATRSPGWVRRISLCSAVSKAQASDPICGSSLGQTTVGQVQPDSTLSSTGTVDSAGRNQFPNLLDQPGIGTQPGADPCPNCVVSGPPDRLTVATSDPSAATGAARVAKASFRSGGSPESGGSPNTYKLWIDIPQDWSAGTLSDATLELFYFGPGGRKHFLSGCSLDTAFPTGHVLEVTTPLYPGEPDIQARLRFTFVPPPGSPLGTRPLTVDSPLCIER